jgi:hypothetical protein
MKTSDFNTFSINLFNTWYGDCTILTPSLHMHGTVTVPCLLLNFSMANIYNGAAIFEYATEEARLTRIGTNCDVGSKFCKIGLVHRDAKWSVLKGLSFYSKCGIRQLLKLRKFHDSE